MKGVNSSTAGGGQGLSSRGNFYLVCSARLEVEVNVVGRWVEEAYAGGRKGGRGAYGALEWEKSTENRFLPTMTLRFIIDILRPLRCH